MSTLQSDLARTRMQGDFVRTRTNRLVQLDISKPSKAMKHFNAKTSNGRIPLVLTPKYASLFKFCMQIPSGMWVLKQRWNAHAGMMDPGLKIFWPAWNRVSHIVTKQAVSFSNPVRFIPTADNVMVDIDISISFQIGPTEEDAVKFVYTLGAHRFDELLYSLTEEAIRGLVHSVTSVDLPPALSATLEETTAFKTRMEEQEKNHENRLRILLNEETQKLTALQKSNERAIQDLLAEKTRADIHRNELRTNAEAKAEVAIAQQIAKNDNKIKEVVGLKADAVATATAATVQRKVGPTVELSNLRRDYEQYVNVARIKRDAIVKAAEREAAQILAHADAEANSAAFLVEKREFDYQQKKLAVEAQLAQSVPLVISGKNGDDLIRQSVLQTLDGKR
ncbi:hypothetical protein PybrP1_008519 [[Pythium] brassicae (nom. inval.)]|nr:hypothetical protein PybrP1_008519 [[Pythium] brassicae (nom. inval.)]